MHKEKKETKPTRVDSEGKDFKKNCVQWKHETSGEYNSGIILPKIFSKKIARIESVSLQTEM